MRRCTMRWMSLAILVVVPALPLRAADIHPTNVADLKRRVRALEDEAHTLAAQGKKSGLEGTDESRRIEWELQLERVQLAQAEGKRDTALAGWRNLLVENERRFQALWGTHRGPRASPAEL